MNEDDGSESNLRPDLRLALTQNISGEISTPDKFPASSAVPFRESRERNLVEDVRAYNRSERSVASTYRRQDRAQISLAFAFFLLAAGTVIRLGFSELSHTEKTIYGLLTLSVSLCVWLVTADIISALFQRRLAREQEESW